MNQAQCPLCGGPASYRSVSEPDGKRFECPACTQFFIDSHTEQELASMGEFARSDFKRDASECARRSGPSRLYVLREPRPDELGGDGYSVARRTIVTEWLER